MGKVSIIVPVYNVENYLRECVNSLIGQTYQDLEIILVDDGSMDRSGEICEEYSRNDARIRVFHQSNQGQSAARNLGVSKSTGEYILFVDSDDYITFDACEKLIKAAQETKSDIVTADILNEKDKIETEKDFRRLPQENIALPGDEYLTEALKANAYDITPWLRLVKKEYLDKIKLSFKEGCYYEDQLYTLQLFTSGCTVTKIRFPFYYYRMDRVGSTTNVANLKKGLDFVRILAAMVKYIDELPNDENLHDSSGLILGLAVYHLADVWLRMSSANQKLVWGQLETTGILKKYLNELRFNNKTIEKKVKLFIHHHRYLNIKNKMKNFIKKRIS